MPHLDNPGGGNCGYYALAISLIDIIKQELAQQSNRTLDHLNRLLAPPLNRTQFLDFDLAQYANNPYSYRRDFLDSFQTSLRNIAVQGYINSINETAGTERLRHAENLSLVDGNETFSKFMSIVRARLFNSAVEHAQFNELNGSPEVNTLANRVLEAFRATPGLQRLDRHRQDQELIKMAKRIFIDDTVNDAAEIKPDSIIITAMRNTITRNGYWATHDHLRMIAAQVQVNLNINGINCGSNQPGIPNVVLNNSRNVHWTTDVQSIAESRLSESRSSSRTPPVGPKPFSKREQEICASLKTAAKVSIQKTGISPVAIQKFEEFVEDLIKKANDGQIFKINEDEDSPDEKLAKKWQEDEFIEAGLRPPRKP